ncbi:Pimeloyl-ACP methyl ester carboxylesterase [Actinacidiphila yanglinensis]|uniref:Pimeloyl-ACP methyl ester carboxylesterase n=1 Tax=Actinacidiphila yanglinensis TaxID=310779 RepID=A0A1H6DRK6_9ACTN|nr:alpha/beta hydrolase [Actinacidiphila yanglinensis]SEG87343.1 Pimeloyl-ACP methyl ester carboxylesterase [Actinacidiphila yanglinensis]
MTARALSSTERRRTAVAVGVAAALTGVLAGCGHSGSSASGPAASHPAASASAAATAGAASNAGSGTGSTLHMITNQGHRLAFHVTPGRGPAIVLDAGGGLDSSYWKNIVPVLAKRTGSEIITYDRAGMGASDAVPGPWKVQSAVSDLEAGLTDLGATRDVVLVSHSEAGEIATYATRQHPSQFAGAVLVDAAVPQFSTDTEVARVAAATQAQVDALKGRPVTKADRQLLAVAADYVADQHAYHRIAWPAGVPATVIVSAQTPFPTSPPDAQAWRDAQAAFAGAAPNRHLVTAAGSSHDIPVDRPDLVEAQIEAMVNSSR